MNPSGRRWLAVCANDRHAEPHAVSLNRLNECSLRQKLRRWKYAARSRPQIEPAGGRNPQPDVAIIGAPAKYQGTEPRHVERRTGIPFARWCDVVVSDDLIHPIAVNQHASDGSGSGDLGVRISFPADRTAAAIGVSMAMDAYEGAADADNGIACPAASARLEIAPVGEFDAKRILVKPDEAAPARPSSVPCDRVERNALQDRSLPLDN